MFTRIPFRRLLFNPKPLSSFSFRYNFCSNPMKNPQKEIQEFERLMNQNTDETLTSAAKMLGYLEVQVERNQHEIAELEEQFQNAPPHVQKIITMIQKLILNIEAQRSEIESIGARVEKQLSDCKDFSMSKVAKEFLQVADSLQKCFKLSLQIHKEQNHETVQIIRQAHQKLINIFEVYGIQEFNPVGQKYDPNKQQALLMIPLQEGKQSNTVAYTMRTGYTIKGRLLRSAHVGVYQ